MILKAKERGGGRQLGLYLLKLDTNEHVEVHELRGFVSSDLPSALQEIDAISRGTKAKNPFFSLSLNPPPGERVSAEAFEAAADAVERKLGLERQPRAIVFHEVEGRRHAHAVWSRIDAQEMKAINLSFYKTKLRGVSKELFLEHGFPLPRGFIDSRECDPGRFSFVEWQQAKRSGHGPNAIKSMFRECWAASDSRKAFESALQARGYTLARGHSRRHVAVDFRGEVYAIARYTELRAKDVRAKLGDPEEKVNGEYVLPAVEKAKSDHATRMTEMLRRHIREADERRKREAAGLLQRRTEVVARQREERAKLEKQQVERRAREMQERQARFRKGWRGLWDRVTGKRSKIEKQNETEAQQGASRDIAEKQRLIQRHIDARRPLHQQMRWTREVHAKQIEELHRDVAGFRETAGKEPSKAQERSRDVQRERQRPRRRRSRDRDFEPER